VLVQLTDKAVPALQAGYTRPGWVERLTVGMIRRGSNRRVQIIRVLSTIGTEQAMSALRALRLEETDPDLKLRLQQALHRRAEARLADQAGDDAGAAEPPATPAANPENPANGDDDGGRHGQAG